jgi:hypothetical protein
MPSLTELIDSREWTTGDKPTVTLHYILDGTSDDLTAKTLLLNSTASTYDGLVRADCTIEPIFVDTDSGKGKWDCRVRYISPERKEPEVGDPPQFSFDTSGGTQHVTQSIATVQKYAPSGKTAPDFKGAIGVTSDNVDGVDITVPVYSFSETHYVADATVTTEYRLALMALTGTVNNAAFKGFAAGECLFLGAAGSKRGAEDWEITFRFAVSPNRTGITVGDITGIAKQGWQYMWVRYDDAEDSTAKAIVKKPVAVYIEKVYADGDFSILEGVSDDE